MTEGPRQRLLLVRHAQTPSNVTSLLDTQVPGPGLTELGLEQAAVVARELAEHRPQRIYVSTMHRTQLTADPLRRRTGAEFVVRDGLREINAGELDMASDRDAIEAYHAFLAACAAGRDATLPGGESSADVIGRFDAVVAEMTADGDGTAVASSPGRSPVVAFSHGAIIRAWCGRRAVNLDETYVMAHPLRNTGSVLLEATPGGWVALTWDQTPLDATPVPTGPPGPTAS